MICQWRNHYILCFGGFAKIEPRILEQNLRPKLLTNCARKVFAFRGVISTAVYTSLEVWIEQYLIIWRKMASEVPAASASRNV